MSAVFCGQALASTESATSGHSATSRCLSALLGRQGRGKFVLVGLGWKETKQRTYSRMEGNKTMHLKIELFLNHTYTHSLLPTGARRCKVWRGGARCVETAARLECRQVNIVCYLFFTNHWSESSSFDQTISSTRSRHVSLKPFTLYEKTSAIYNTWYLSEVVLNFSNILTQ